MNTPIERAAACCGGVVGWGPFCTYHQGFADGWDEALDNFANSYTTRSLLAIVASTIRAKSDPSPEDQRLLMGINDLLRKSTPDLGPCLCDGDDLLALEPANPACPYHGTVVSHGEAPTSAAEPLPASEGPPAAHTTPESAYEPVRPSLREQR